MSDDDSAKKFKESVAQSAKAFGQSAKTASANIAKSSAKVAGAGIGRGARGAGNIVMSIQNKVGGDSGFITRIPFGLGYLIYPFWILFRTPVAVFEHFMEAFGKRIVGPIATIFTWMLLIGALIWAGAYVLPHGVAWMATYGITSIDDGIRGMQQGWSAYWENLGDTWEKQIALATGGYYEGEEEGDRTGIFLENVMTSDPKYYPGDDVTVFANVRGQGNFDNADPSEMVTINCLMIDNDLEAVDMYPPQIPVYTLTDSPEVFECTFPAGQFIIDEPTKEVEVSIDFPFTTEGRLTLYFMDQDLILDLRAQDKSPNDVYNIPNRPQAKFEPGPVEVGLGTLRGSPIGLDQGVLQTRLGFTLQNAWPGEIKRVTGVEIIVDEGITLQDPGGQIPHFSGYSTRNGRDVYTVNPDLLNRKTDDGRNPISTFTSLNFRMLVDRGALTGTTFSPREIDVAVSYEYSLWQTTHIQFQYNPMLDYDEDPEANNCGSGIDAVYCPPGWNCCRCTDANVCLGKPTCSTGECEKIAGGGYVLDHAIPTEAEIAAASASAGGGGGGGGNSCLNCDPYVTGCGQQCCSSSACGGLGPQEFCQNICSGSSNAGIDCAPYNHPGCSISACEDSFCRSMSTQERCDNVCP